jgi:hypothetical protein
MQYPSSPQLRVSTVNVLTNGGWCAGTFHGPGRRVARRRTGSDASLAKASCTAPGLKPMAHLVEAE